MSDTAPQSDREALIAICERLKLERCDDPDRVQGGYSFGDERYAVTDTTISIGCGEDGYNGFYVEFMFDAAGNAIKHKVSE